MCIIIIIKCPFCLHAKKASLCNDQHQAMYLFKGTGLLKVEIKDFVLKCPLAFILIFLRLVLVAALAAHGNDKCPSFLNIKIIFDKVQTLYGCCIHSQPQRSYQRMQTPTTRSCTQGCF